MPRLRTGWSHVVGCCVSACTPMHTLALMGTFFSLIAMGKGDHQVCELQGRLHSCAHPFLQLARLGGPRSQIQTQAA